MAQMRWHAPMRSLTRYPVVSTGPAFRDIALAWAPTGYRRRHGHAGGHAACCDASLPRLGRGSPQCLAALEDAAAADLHTGVCRFSEEPGFWTLRDVVDHRHARLVARRSTPGARGRAPTVTIAVSSGSFVWLPSLPFHRLAVRPASPLVQSDIRILLRHHRQQHGSAGMVRLLRAAHAARARARLYNRAGHRHGQRARQRGGQPVHHVSGHGAREKGVDPDGRVLRRRRGAFSAAPQAWRNALPQSITARVLQRRTLADMTFASACSRSGESSRAWASASSSQRAPCASRGSRRRTGRGWLVGHHAIFLVGWANLGQTNYMSLLLSAMWLTTAGVIYNTLGPWLTTRSTRGGAWFMVGLFGCLFTTSGLVGCIAQYGGTTTRPATRRAPALSFSILRSRGEFWV
ncbi:Sugar transporter STL1 [Tolypocladium paradoxum]|uniref:Sugar transporter STL1 n=1 Tax=Tolypocladium paradoxum TaxID=94208 RepID=A0A2S4L334_9HYPO|nr:Sugar transporter STL1 [Tolypocladium paradoxum]